VSSRDEGFDSPEAAALASWRTTPSARARALSTTIRGRRAEVVVATDQTDADYVDYVYCVQDDQRQWREVVSGNVPTDRWDDPTYLDWED
jgi:hypothetical protein